MKLRARLCGSCIALMLPLACHGQAGQVDTTFAAGTLSQFPYVVRQTALLAQAGGKIVDAGHFEISAGFAGLFCSSGFIARFDASGNADASFGDEGLVAADASLGRPTIVLDDRCIDAAIVDAEQRIVVFGTEPDAQVGSIFAIRFLPDGSPDPSFGDGGHVSVSTGIGNVVLGAVVQQNGGYVIAGYFRESPFRLIRLHTDGSLDPDFGVAGVATLDTIATTSAIALQPDGKIVMAGYQSSTAILGRILPNGEPDPAFGVGGVVDPAFQILPNAAPTLAVQPDGKLLLGSSPPSASTVDRFLVARFLPDGSLDRSFGVSGSVVTPFEPFSATLAKLEIMPDGRFVASGTARSVDPNSVGSAFAVAARYESNGSLDRTFGLRHDGRAYLDSDEGFVSAMRVQPDGGVVLAIDGGVPQLVKLTGDGTVPVVEFYHAALDHYFITADPREVHDLDFGFHAGWARTGLDFDAYPAAAPGSNPVCRYYIPPQHGDSHFLSAAPDECAAVAARSASDPNFSGYVLETSSAFFAALPDPASGACPESNVPVFRLWNARADSNHRYTTSMAVKQQMQSRGYIAEGYGAAGVAMCAAP